MLGAVCANDGCGRMVRYPKRIGQPPKYCSMSCRRAAEYLARRKTVSFNNHAEGFRVLGEAEVRRRLDDDPDFAVQLIELTETYLGEADGRADVPVAPEVWELFTGTGRRFSVATGHDTPLPPDHDVDYAEQTGDWYPMVEAALHAMSWQIEQGFKPDLREWSFIPPAVYGLAA